MNTNMMVREHRYAILVMDNEECRFINWMMEQSRSLVVTAKIRLRNIQI